ncbi:esterase-like activity of phytase family protein [Variovorax sp. HJSM1_2]|uniref:esterase-like activity of phytase family protein n=1 Tax=Variovorax sp. HJSM1_2 TaxID=3366263 RepID=UPI003BDA871F
MTNALCSTFRATSTVALCLSLLACATGQPTPPSTPPTTPLTLHLRLIGETSLPHRLNYQGTTVGGLSALDYDPVKNLWFALSDDRSDLQPARFYSMRLAITAEGIAPPQLVGVTTLRQADGQAFPSRRQEPNGVVPDPEGLRWRAQTGTLLWSSEGDIQHGTDPSVCEMRPDGTHLRCLDLPAHLRADRTGASGPRDNLTLEGLATTPDGRGVWAAMENALVQDGPMPTLNAPGGPSRITLFDVGSGKPVAQRAYVTDAIPAAPVPPQTFADNGISEILAIDAFRLLVLERSFTAGVGNSLRLYQVDTRDGSDTLQQDTLAPGTWQPMRKTLVANLDDFVALNGQPRPGLRRLDNTEGMAWGPRIMGKNGRPGPRTLVLISDDNFNARQTTQIIAFEFLESAP